MRNVLLMAATIALFACEGDDRIGEPARHRQDVGSFHVAIEYAGSGKPDVAIRTMLVAFQQRISTCLGKQRDAVTLTAAIDKHGAVLETRISPTDALLENCAANALAGSSFPKSRGTGLFSVEIRRR